MTVLLTIYKKDGEKVFSFEDIYPDSTIIDVRLVKNFLEVLQELFKNFTGKTQVLQGFNLQFYLKTSTELSIILAVDQKLDDLIVEKYLLTINQEIEKYAQAKKSPVTATPVLQDQTSESLTQTIRKILSPLLVVNYNFADLQTVQETKPLLKIGMLGNARAGKSSILKKFFDKWQLESLVDIKATIGLEIVNKFESFLQQNILTFDFVGHKTFIESYLTKKDILEDFVLLIFVIDITQPEYFLSSFDYLNQIIDHLKKNSIKIPKLSIFIHKYDPDKRVGLKQNLHSFLEIFSQYNDANVSLYLTSIYDASSNIALIQSLYFSMPEIMIELILEEKFIYEFEKQILQPFISQQWSKDYITVLQMLDTEIRQLNKEKSLSFGAELQKQWLQTLVNQQPSSSNKKNSDIVNVIIKGQEILIKIKDWSHKNISNEIVIPLLSWTLEGIVSSFYFHEVKFLRERDHYLYWIIER